MKTKLVFYLLIIALLFTGYYFYPFSNSSSASINSLIPETSLVVFQANNVDNTFQKLESFTWFEAINEVPLIARLFSEFNSIDSLERSGVLKSRLTDLQLWFTLHTTSSNDLTPMFIIKSSGFKWKYESIESILESISGKEFSSDYQNFNNRDIVIYKTNDLSVATIIEGDYLVFSEKTILLEDVVRSIQDESKRMLLEKEGFNTDDDLAIIVNSERLSELDAIFFEDSPLSFRNQAVNGNLMMTLNLEENKVSFRGSAINSGVSEKYEPAPIFAKNVIPITSNSFSWQPFNFQNEDWSVLFENGLCRVNMNVGGQESSELLILQVKDTATLRSSLLQLAEKNLLPSDSSVYRERFINSEINYINKKTFLNEFLTDEKSEFEAPYFTVLQNMLLISENLDALKTALNDFDSETTWGRSIDQRRILEDMIQETDLTFVQDFEFAADPLKKKLKPKWKTFFEANPEVLNVLEMFKFQLNKTSNNVLVSGDLAFRSTFKVGERKVITDDLTSSIMANVFADTLLTTKPYVVRNHNNSRLEVIFQDLNNNVYLSTKQGEILWKKDLGGTLRGEIQQIDFYNNKKLQYLLFSDSLIHLIDRNGNNVEGFPKRFDADLPFDGSQVIDYDNSKRYRFLTKDRRGRLSLFNKEGIVLEGWDLKSLGGALLKTPFHVRIRGRDCFVVVEENGRVHLLNRKGEEYKGFPVNVGGRFAGDVALIKGSNFSQTHISLMKDDGELVQINLLGDVLNKKQLLRNSTNATFSMSFDALKTTFNTVRNDGSTLTFFDEKNTEKFSVDYPNSKQLEVDFYNFRNGKEVYVVRDTKEGIMRMLDGNGQFLTGVIPTDERVSILYYQNRLEYEVFVNFANQMNVYAVKPF